MSSSYNYSYNVLINRFEAFAAGHLLIKRFTHGQIDLSDQLNDDQYPFMHVTPDTIEPVKGAMQFGFHVMFADIPRDKETKAEYQREVISDCVRLGQDLIAEIQNGLELFGFNVQLVNNVVFEPFMEEQKNTVTGVAFTVKLEVPWDWSACDIPAVWAVGGNSTGGSGSPIGLLLQVNGVNNVVQSELDLVAGTNVTLTDNGDGSVTIDATGGGGGGSGTVTSVALTAPAAFNVSGSPVTTSGTLALSAAGNASQYITGAGTLQTFPAIPAAQVNSDWNAVSGVAQILNKPTLAAVATSGDYNDLSNLPFIPENLKDLQDVSATLPTNGQVLTFNSTSGEWEPANNGTGTVTSVDISVPNAFNVSGNPITSSGTIAITAAGTSTQYITGDGQLANFPTIPAAQIQSDWTQTNNAAVDFIKNKPSVGSGIAHGTAAGTDTYTVSITGVASYADGDAYLIRFTNGNTTTCTLNINSLGAVTLYRNNDGALIGGDIWEGAEMLCIYNSTLNVFQCIGTSSNSLFAYVTNAEPSTTITKGQPVYAFGGTGDRLTVKLAYNTSDATSAQTVGMVVSTSIAPNQKGIIIVAGQLDNLSTLPTPTFADGDAIYLGATAGSITNVKPSAPNHLVYLGIVTTASAGNAGRMYVRVQNGYELKELHDVDLISTPPANNDVLVFDTSTTPDLWKAKSIQSILGYTPAQRDTFTIRMGVGPAAPADSTTYYFGEAALNLSTVATLWDNKIAFACKLVGAQIMANNSTGTATSEASTISVRINNTTDVLLSNAVVFTGVPATSTSYTVTGLTQNIAANDELTIKWVTPAWATNPTGAQLVVTLYFERT